MAVDPEAGEFKFYTQFQTERGDNKQSPFEGDNWSSYFSPVESEIGSFEIESDKDDGDGGDEDYTAELSRRMAQFMLQDDDNSSTARFQSEIQNKSWGLSGSPISTLWSPLGSSNGSSYGSPEGPSKEPSPPTTPMVAERRGLDISQNVFTKLEKMKKVSTNGKSIQTRPQDEENGSSSSSKDQTRALKNQRRKQNQQFMKQKGSAAIMGKQAQGSSSQGNSGGKPGGLSGTGVFLPRHVNYNRSAPSPQPPQPPKKTKAAAGVRIATQTVKKSHPVAAAAAAEAATSQTDIDLPQEWTY